MNYENLLYLQKSLQGGAKETVESLPIYPDNVEEIIKQLEFRFGREDILIRNQINKFKVRVNVGHL